MVAAYYKIAILVANAEITVVRIYFTSVIQANFRYLVQKFFELFEKCFIKIVFFRELPRVPFI